MKNKKYHTVWTKWKTKIIHVGTKWTTKDKKYYTVGTKLKAKILHCKNKINNRQTLNMDMPNIYTEVADIQGMILHIWS
jgi:hypothetical protein